MKIFGYQNIEVEAPKLMELSEISLCASPTKLREVAIFLQNMANAIEKDDFFEHEHLQDNCEDWPLNFPDIIVCAQS